MPTKSPWNKPNEPTLFEMSSVWGDAISWMFPEQFQKRFTPRTKFRVTGHKTPLPKVGDLLKAEFHKSWMWFRFVDVEGCRDPRDMFFGDVRIVKQSPKDGSESYFLGNKSERAAIEKWEAGERPKKEFSFFI